MIRLARLPALGYLHCLVLMGISSGSSAQTSCVRVDDTSYCQGPEGSSTMNMVGNTTFVQRSDGSSATLQRVGDNSVITDSREGMSGIAQHTGDTTIIQLPRASSVCNKIGNLTLCS